MMSNEDTSQQSICPVCNTTDIAVFVKVAQVPVHCCLFWPTREEAIQVPRGNIRLGFCRDCGHIFNLAFKPELMKYTQAYENSLHFSPRFQSYVGSLAARLIDRYDLRGKDIIEIGCGKGDFLRLLCALGANRGVGFDPSYAPEQNGGGTTAERITFIQDFYSKRHADYKADLICCRQVLEHIQFPGDFLNGVRHSIGNRPTTVVFFEVPNVLFTLRDLGIWELIYEHCSYFSRSSLSYLFTSSVFKKVTPLAPPPQTTTRCPACAIRSRLHCQASTLRRYLSAKVATSETNSPGSSPGSRLEFPKPSPREASMQRN